MHGPPSGVPTDAPVSPAPGAELFCDESGYEGENLVGGITDVFAHAGVTVPAADAADCIRELRDRIRSPATVYKANHLQREKHRGTLLWFLGPEGPLPGRARVHLTEKSFFTVARIVDLLVSGTDPADAPAMLRGAHARGPAGELYRAGPRVYGRERWRAFLASFNELMWINTRRGAETSADGFFGLAGELHRAGAPGEAGRLLGLVRQARPRADALRAALLEDPRTVPALDSLLPALAAAVAYWGRDGAPVTVVHDRQTALTDERMARLYEVCRPPRAHLRALRFVDAETDPRVQLADFLAGIARKRASDALAGLADPELDELLRPYVAPDSAWGDARSWALLAPGPAPRAGLTPA
ncbi:hypothetical protein [Streptomyces sp. CMB-StM0423]|uniref:hypothetical protein n=1 Tax=Streptomyces sp. CMB-StM0423 TaxID=2059884 RepID=UPI000C701C8E|nr:hypothetical protein [Streptomyces sp. CMB-StM0423]AUH40360.1 hypothetical protein CXR04_08940 [Streptomyces sp. CMB-StM0423]